MKKTFAAAVTLMVVAMSAVYATPPAVALPEDFGGIHLHLAGKVGQKAVLSTIIFGAEGLKGVPQNQSAANSCLAITKYEPGHGMGYSLSPIPDGWGEQCSHPFVWEGKTFQIPASGSFAETVPLPNLPAGAYQLWFGAVADYPPGKGNPVLQVVFEIGTDGTFTMVKHSQ